MSNIGLLFVGAILFVNGIGVLGGTTARATAPLNILVGAMQTVIPTLLLILGDRSVATIWSIAPLYLFGFTYLFVGINRFIGNDDSALGWYSIFVAVMAVIFAIDNVSKDPVFAVIWLIWAIMWFMFFLIMSLGKTQLGPFTGWLLVIGGHITCTIPGLLLLRGTWSTKPWAGFTALGIAILLVGVSVYLGRVKPTLNLGPAAGTENVAA